jgi:hypothetical protein
MKIEKIGRFLTMDSLNFTVDGVDFLIDGTQIVDGVCWVDLKNLSNGKRSTVEHQKICQMILERQDRPEVKQKKTTTKSRQLGFNI